MEIYFNELSLDVEFKIDTASIKEFEKWKI